MRTFSSRALPVLLGLTAAAAALRAAPRPDSPPTAAARVDRELAREETRQFAASLLAVVDHVAEEYYRPVRRDDLLHAALAGLYEGARRPVPRDLKARIRAALGTEPSPVTVTGANIPGPGLTAGDLPAGRLVREVREEVGDAEALRGRSPLVVCGRALARTLDPHSGVVTAEEGQKSFGLDLESDGVGLELVDTGSGPVVVEAVHLGGPAQRAGLRPGDLVVRLDGRPFRSAPPAARLALRDARVQPTLAPLTPEEGTAAEPLPRAVRVTFRRPGEEAERTAELSRERHHPETVLGVSRRDDNRWNYYVDEKRGIAHVRVSHLSKGTGDELRRVLTALRDVKLAGLVLDLRWCPGGYLTESVEVADLFLGDAVIATVKARGREDDAYRSADEGDGRKFRDFPMVVLADGTTTGGAELIAAALQDHGRAKVVGMRTVGKGSVQTPVALDGHGVILKLTSGTFVRPNGRPLHRFPESKPEDDWGVRPDAGCESRVSPDLNRRLKEWWQLQSLRPGRSAERLPLDDPRAEPHAQAALGVLREMMAKKETAAR